MHHDGRILIVEDDRSTQNLIASILEKANYTTEKVGSGEDALKSVYTNEPALAILDIRLPGMSGFDVAKELQARTNVPFMFMTAQTDEETIRRGVEYGAVGYIIKPVEPRNLAPAVEAGLARASEIRALRTKQANLTIALETGRESAVAVGLIMARYRLDSESAFDVLRDYARQSRRKVNEVAKEIVEAEEVFNRLTPCATRIIASKN